MAGGHVYPSGSGSMCAGGIRYAEVGFPPDWHARQPPAASRG